MSAGAFPIQIACEFCGNSVPAVDINIQNGMAKCMSCDSVFSIAMQTALAQRPLPVVGVPRSLRVRDFGGELRLSRKWFTSDAFGMLLLTLVSFGVIGPFLGIIIQRLAQGAPVSWLLFAFMTPFVAIGGILVYVTLAMFINTTVITVTASTLSASHGPMKFRRSVSIDTADVEQVFVMRSGPSDRDGSYEVLARLVDDEDRELIADIPDFKAARFIEQEIERFLGLPDLPVTGEASA